MDDEQRSTDFNVRVGANLKRLRQARAWSQTDLADRLAAHGIRFAQQTVLKIEKGTRPLQLGEAAAIADLFEISLSRLVHLEDDDKALTDQSHTAELTAKIRQASVEEQEEIAAQVANVVLENVFDTALPRIWDRYGGSPAALDALLASVRAAKAASEDVGVDGGER